MAERADKRQKRKAEAQREVEKEERKSRHITYVIIAAVVVVVVYVLYFVFTNYVSTPFPTFLSNFKSGQRVAIAATYYNTTQVPYLTACVTDTLEVLGYKTLTNIDFFMLNSTTCTYSPTGFGPGATLSTEAASACLSIAKGEPSIFLNYSATNKTIITPYHLYVYGNAAYMRECGMAAELSR